MGFLKSLFKPKPKTIKDIIIKEFYSDYPEVPYISKEQEMEWVKNAGLFIYGTVEKSMMKRYADGLLPGHVYMLYWLGKYTNKKVPKYFEYKYGVDFEKEKTFLYENGFLNDDDKPTSKGEKAIKKHYKVIEKHANKPDRSIEGIKKQILEEKKRIRQMGSKMYTYHANRNCCEKCKALDEQHFKLSEMKIGVNAPPMHEGCACSISAYEDEEEYEAWLDYLDKGGTTEEWETKHKK